MSIQPQHFRPFKIEVFGLQDAYLGTLYSYNDGFIGQVEEPNVTVSTDGSSTFTCSIPKYYIDPTTNQKVLNPRWGDVENGVLAENTRVLKVFVSFENEVKIFPFIINKIRDKRDKSFSVFKEVEGGGLAFAELGKQGYKLELNQTLVEYALEKDPNIAMTVQYWLDQVFPNVKDANGKIIQWLTPWCYEVRMDWSSYSDFQRDSTKVYEDEYVSNWDVGGKALVPSGYTAAREKARSIDCHNSNKYNITQSIAEAFEIFCDYDYKCDAAGRFIGEYTDEKGNVWTGRKALFYNQAISQENPLHIYYQKNLQSISRAAESEELFTKLFVTPIKSSSMENGYVTIADTMANPTLDDFLLNFDYLYSVNSISEYQMQFVKEYEASIRSLNLKLLHASPILNDLVAQINDQKAELAGLDKKVAAAKEQLTYHQKLRDNELTNGTVIKDKSNATSIIFTEDNGVYKAALRFEGIVKGTIYGYKDSSYDTLLFSADQLKEITDISFVGDTGYYVLLDEYGYPSYICSKKPDESLIYLSLEYSPTNKYETICQTFYNEIDLNTQRKTAIEETINSLEENYTAQEKEYNNILAAKEALNQKLERVLGPALREGYWTPDEYDDPGKQYIKQFTQPQFNSALSETCFFYDSEPFDNEQLAYYYIDSSKTYYPYLRINSLINKWSDKDIDNLVIHLQRDFVGTMQSTTALTAGNYFFLCNNKKYYFSLTAAQIATGNTLTVRMSGTEVSLLLNGSTSIVLSNYLTSASNLTSFFEGATENLADYYLYNNAGFVFAFMNIEGNICEPVLLFNNEDLADIYENYTRVAYSFVGENIVTSIQGYLTKNTNHELYYPRFYLAEDNVFSSSNLLTVALKKGEEETILEKYYDYSILLRQGKTYVTLKITSDNPIWKFVSNEYYYEVNYRSSLANDLLYLDAKEVAKENSQPKYSYDLSVAILPTQNGKISEVKLGQLAYISDPILGVRAATGYVSEITFDLKKPQNDNIKIANYKTKFEDLFQTITASSEAMKNNQTSYDIAAGSFGPDGSISGDVIQTAINNNSFFFDYSATGVEIDPVNGIVLTNKKPYMNGVYGQVVLQGGGVFLSSSIDPLTGERIWNTGITPNGINASIINAGQLNTNLIKIYSGDEMAFQWNSEGIYAYKFDDNGKAQNDTYIKYSQDGLHYTKEQINEDGTRSNPLHIVSLDWDGLTLCNNQGQKTLSLEAETGDLLISGTMQSFNYSPGIIGTGWKIDQAGYAEFNDIFVRGTISAAVFEYKETSAVGGELYVAPTIILESDKTTSARFTYAEGTPLQVAINIPFNDDYELAGRVWQVGDLVSLNGIVLSKDETEKYEIKNLRMKVSAFGEKTVLVTEAPIYSTTQNIFYDGNGNPISVATIKNLGTCKGSGKWHLIFLGSNGQREGILITAMANDGPYIDIYDDNRFNSQDKSPRVRLGKLNGLQQSPTIAELYPNISGYGLYSDNVYLKGAIYATSGKIGSLTIDEVENTSDIVNNITTTNTSGQVIINKGALTADSIGAGVITTNHLSSQVGEELELSSNKSIALIVDNIEKDYTAELEVTSKGIRAEVVNIQTNLQSQITENKSSISQTSEEIKTEVTRATEAEGKLNSTISQTATEIRSEVSESIEGVNSTISQTAKDITLSVSETYATKQNLNDTLDSYYTKTETDAAINISSENITLSVSETYATKNEFNSTLESYYTKTETDAAINTSSENITLSVSKTYTTKNEFSSALEDYSTKKETSAAIEISSENILSAVKSTYTTKNDLNSTLKEYYTITETNAAIETSKTGILSTVSNTYATIDNLGNYALTDWATTQIEQSAKSITAKVESGDITSGKVKTSKITIDANSVSIATGGTFTVTGNNFIIKNDGSVEMKGKVTATEGAIGGWTIGETSLYSGSSNNYVALSSDSTTSSRIWAGDEDANAAPFRVEKDGTVTLTKIRVLETNSENATTGEEKIISLYSQPFWAIWPAYKGAIKNLSTDGGVLTIETYGNGSVTFKKAAVGVGNVILAYNGRPGSVIATVKDVNGGQLYQNEVSDGGAFNNGLKDAYPTVRFEDGMAYPYTTYVGVTQSEGTAVAIPNKITSISLSNQFQSTSSKRVTFTATAAGTNLADFSNTSLYVDASEIYNAGANSITVTNIEASGPVYGDKTVSVNMEAALSDGRKAIFSSSYIDCTKIYNNGQNSVTLSKSWSGGILTVKASNGMTSIAKISKGSETWDGDTCSFPVMDEQGLTGYTMTVDASVRYTAGVNSVTVPNTNIVRQAADYYTGDDDHSTTIYIRAQASNGKYGIQSFSVSGASAYAAGYSAGSAGGSDLVTLSKSWKGGILTVKASNGITSTAQISKGTETWDGNTCSFPIMDGQDSTGYTCSVDASARYTAGANSVSVGKVEAYDEAYRGGNYIHIPTEVTLENSVSSWMGNVSADCSSIFKEIEDSITVDTVVITGNTWTQGEYAYANVTATASNTKYKTQQISIHAKDIYDAGADSITVTGIEASGPVYGDKTVSVNMEATLSDGRKAIFSSSYIDCTKIYNNGQNSVTLSKSWSSGILTVKASNGVTSIAKISKGSETWDENTCSFPVMDEQGSTGYTMTVDATKRYNAGKSSVTVSDTTWKNGIFTATMSNGITATTTISKGTETLSGNVYSIPIMYDTNGNTGYTITVDASARFTAGENSVTLSKSWDSGILSVTASNGKSSTVQLSKGTETWKENKCSFPVLDGQGSTGYTITVDASGIYSSGQTAGANAVTLTNTNGWQGGVYTVNASNGKSHAVNLPTFSTSGGTTFDDSHKTTVYFSTASVNTPLKSVVVDATSVYNEGASSVTLSSGGWVNGTNTVSASNGQTETVSLPAFSASGGTSFNSEHRTTVYFFTDSVTGPLTSAIVNASSVYDDGYATGYSNASPASVSRVATYDSTANAYNVTVAVKSADGTSARFNLVAIDASSAYDAGYAAGYDAGKAAMGLSRDGNTITVAVSETKTLSAGLNDTHYVIKGSATTLTPGTIFAGAAGNYYYGNNIALGGIS